MKKRIISVLLLCCMVLGLLPMTTFANNGGAKAIQLGTSGISGYDSTNSSYDYIHFGTWNNSTVKWRVLDTKTNMPNAQERDGFFLLSDALLGTGEFGGVEFDYTTPYTNDWKGSRAQDWCNDFYSRSLSTTEQKAVLATSKSDDPCIDGYFMGSENILNGDKVFFLSAEEAGNAAYGFTDDNARIANYGDSAGGWWLRSPHQDYNYAGVVKASGGVRAEWVNDTNAARPAFNLKPDSVLLVSAAVGGKGAVDGISRIPEYSGNEWKLTILDDTRAFRVTETTAVGKPGGTVTLNFSGARTGENEYISAIIEGENGATHYRRIMKPTAADRQLSFTLPYDLASGNYKLHVFSEQCNGDYKTDYASGFQTVALTVEEAATEQFALTPGGTYYFDLSGENISGIVNDNLPDKSMHYVPFTYAGTVDAYKLTSEMVTTEEYAQKNEYAHSLFVADYAVTYRVIWNTLNDAGLIFGKNYATGGVSYTLRAPSMGSGGTDSGNSKCGTPQSNEWDRILDKNDGYIKNWSKISSCGQDSWSTNVSNRAFRGKNSTRDFGSSNAVTSFAFIGFRPVLEVLNPDTLGSDGLKAVTLDLGGGKLGGSSEDIRIIVKNGSEFTAPVSDGLTRPDGNTGSYFMWLGSDGELYAPGDNVPADVTRLTAQFALIEQFKLAPGDTYYFDLSGANIPGTVNGNLPDKSMHYVPFTYVGIVDAYKLKSEMATTEEYAQKNGYAHSLFVADYAVTHTTSWKELYAKDLIFGKGYATGGVDYTLRMPSMGSGDTGSGNSKRGTPQSNEWDRILDKNDGYIKNWSGMSSWGQDTSNIARGNRALRGHESARSWGSSDTTISIPDVGFRPVLEVLNFGTLDSYGLKAVTLDLGGGKLGNSSEDIQIIVKNGESFTAPASDGLARPDGDTGSSFMWLGSDSKLYAPGDNVSADVTRLTAQFDEQFTLTTGDTYWFDLSGVGIPGTANSSLPDTLLHYVPFTYAGTVDAYKLTSEMVTTEEYAQQNQYAHSLFVADYAVTHTVGWDNLDGASLIFGKNYATGGISYTLRAPSTGSGGTGSGNSRRGTPQSNEWDRILDKDDEYIKNWSAIYSWGQDTSSSSLADRARRGDNSARNWSNWNATYSRPVIGFRPVLEILNPDTLGSDGLKAVTLDLGGGKLGNSSEDIQIIVKNGESFTAPASDGLTRPDGDTGSYFMWLGSDSKLYAPGSSVPANVNKLTAQFGLTEQFTLAPGGTCYFDLSVENIPGTVKGNLPDKSMHYVPFTYAGTVDAYKLTSEMATTEEYAEENKYLHSLFVADYAVTYAVSWNTLNDASLIFGKDYTSGGIDYTMRVPSAGSDSIGSGNSQRGTPQSNEWDRILDKNDGYIKNCGEEASWGQDTPINSASDRAYRGYVSVRDWGYSGVAFTFDKNAFRPVLEVLNPDTLGSDGLKAVTLDLGGGKLGGSSEDIQIIVKNGSAFTAPAYDGLTRPDGDTGSYFMWLDGDGNLYAPGDNVPADVTRLTAQFAPSSHSVTITTDSLPDGKVDEAYSQNLIADGTAPITWNISGGNLPDGLKLYENTGEISGTPTVEGTATFTVKAENITGSDTKELSITIVKVLAAEHTVTVKTDGNGTASSSHAKAVVGTEITLTATPDTGYRFKEWEVESPAGLVINSDKFFMPDGNVEVKAIFEEDTPPTPTDPAKPGISVTGTYTYDGSEHTATVTGYDSSTMDISGNTGTDAGDYTVSVTSKTGKWVDGSTEAVTAAWSIGKATQEAPNGLTGVAPTTEGGSDGMITGVTDKMEYRMVGEGSYTACGGTEIENLPAGNYFVRYAEDNNHFAGTDAEVTVGEGASLADCTITFEGNGGSGSMGPVTVKEGANYVLPACGFSAPADQEFKAWEIGGTEYKVGDPYTVNGDTEIKALWENSVIPPTTYTITVITDGNGSGTASPSAAVFGTEITLTATPNTGYQFKEWEVISGGVTIKDDKFTMPDGNVEVKAIFAMISQQTDPDPVNENTGIPSLPENSDTAPAAYADSGTNNGNSTAPASPLPPTPGTEPAPGIKPDAENTRRTTPNDNGILKERQDICDNAATITGDHPAMDEETEEGNTPFTDVSEDDWFYDDVMFVYENGLTEGISKTQFGPYETQTRGRMAEILWHMEGSPAPKVKNSFADVEDGIRYADAVAWITENDILNGYSEDSFGPEDPITYEQLAVMFYRYAEYKGYDVSIKENPDRLKGMDSMTDEAGKAMLWAVSNGLIQKESNGLSAPQDPVPQAEIAAMIHRFIEKYELAQGMTPNGQMGWTAPEEMNPSQTDSSRVPGWIGISLCAALAGGFVLFMLWLRRRRSQENL